MCTHKLSGACSAIYLSSSNGGWTICCGFLSGAALCSDRQISGVIGRLRPVERPIWPFFLLWWCSWPISCCWVACRLESNTDIHTYSSRWTVGPIFSLSGNPHYHRYGQCVGNQPDMTWIFRGSTQNKKEGTTHTWCFDLAQKGQTPQTRWLQLRAFSCDAISSTIKGAFQHFCNWLNTSHQFLMWLLYVHSAKACMHKCTIPVRYNRTREAKRQKTDSSQSQSFVSLNGLLNPSIQTRSNLILISTGVYSGLLLTRVSTFGFGWLQNFIFSSFSILHVAKTDTDHAPCTLDDGILRTLMEAWGCCYFHHSLCS